MNRGGDHHQLVGEEREHRNLVHRPRIDHNGKVDLVSPQMFDQLGSIGRRNTQNTIGKTFVEFTQHLGQDELARRGARPDPQAPPSPAVAVADFDSDAFHLMENTLRLPVKLIPVVGDVDFSPAASDELTPQIVLQILHRMADGGLREIQLARGLRKTSGLDQGAKRENLAAVDRFLHEFNSFFI